LDDRRTLDALETIELVPQTLESRARHRRALHRHRLTLARRQDRFGVANISILAVLRAWPIHASQAWLCFCASTSRERLARASAASFVARSRATASAFCRFTARVTLSRISVSGGTPAGIASIDFSTTQPAGVLTGDVTPPMARVNAASCSGSPPNMGTRSS